MKIWIVCALLGLSACKRSSMEPADAGVDAGPDLALDPSIHPPLPIITNEGGPVLASIEQWVIVWKGDEARGQEAQVFLTWLLTSDFWKTSLTEYGVGAGVAKGVIVLPEAAPTTFDVGTMDALVASAASTAGITINPSSAFAVLIPSQTMVSESGFSVGCTQVTSFHDESTNHIPYELIMKCGSRTLEHELTHEVSETACDPLFTSNPAWVDYDFGSEPEFADFCAYLNDVMVTDADGTIHVVPRLYSNAIAMTGVADPCVPAPMAAYFNVASGPVVVPVMGMADGSGKATFSLVPFTYGAATSLSWQIGTNATGVTFSPATGTTMTGDKVSIDVTVTKQVQSGTVFYIHALAPDGTSNVWTSAIQTQ